MKNIQRKRSQSDSQKTVSLQKKGQAALCSSPQAKHPANARTAQAVPKLHPSPIPETLVAALARLMAVVIHVIITLLAVVAVVVGVRSRAARQGRQVDVVGQALQARGDVAKVAHTSGHDLGVVTFLLQAQSRVVGGADRALVWRSHSVTQTAAGAPSSMQVLVELVLSDREDVAKAALQVRIGLITIEDIPDSEKVFKASRHRGRDLATGQRRSHDCVAQARYSLGHTPCAGHHNGRSAWLHVSPSQPYTGQDPARPGW